jgi:hypothetical protein
MKIKKREYCLLAIILGILLISAYSILGIEIGGVPPSPRLQLSTQCSFVFAASDTTKTCTLGSEYWNSELHGYIITIPTFSATNPTATLTIKNPAGQTVYGPISGLAEGTTHPYTPTSRPLTFGSSYVILLTTTAGTGGGTCTIDSWVYK